MVFKLRAPARPSKSLLTARLEHAVDTIPACSICHLKAEAEDRYLDMLLYERVNDDGTRQKLADEHGFCPTHTYRLAEVGGYGCHVKLALLYRRVASQLAEEVEALGPDGSRAPTYAPDCAACRAGTETEDRYLELLVKMLRQADFRERYEASFGLCMDHFLRVYRQSEPEVCRFLRADQAVRLRRLADDLDEFVRKSVVKDEVFGEEKDSWIRVLRRCAGSLQPEDPRNNWARVH